MDFGKVIGILIILLSIIVIWNKIKQHYKNLSRSERGRRLIQEEKDFVDEKITEPFKIFLIVVGVLIVIFVFSFLMGR